MNKKLDKMLQWPQWTLDPDQGLQPVPAGSKAVLVTKIHTLEKRETDIPARIRYRGISRKFLAGHFRADSEEYLYESLFYIGQKGCAFRKQTVTRLNSCDNEMLNDIFDEISSNAGTTAPKKTFFEKFFTNPTNRVRFIEMVDDDLDIRDYYLAYLHKIGSTRVSSFFLSSTSKLEVARGFAKGIEAEPRELLCYIYADPLPELGRGRTLSIDPQDETYRRFIKEKLKARKLPHCNWPYEKESETMIMAGIMPHLLWCIADLTNRKLIVHPRLFHTPPKTLYLNIDQSNFDEELAKRTYYISSFTRARNQISENPKAKI